MSYFSHAIFGEGRGERRAGKARERRVARVQGRGERQRARLQGVEASGVRRQRKTVPVQRPPAVAHRVEGARAQEAQRRQQPRLGGGGVAARSECARRELSASHPGTSRPDSERL